MNPEQMKTVVFGVILLLVVVVIAAFFLFQAALLLIFPWLVLAIIVLAVFSKYDFLVQLQEYERALVFRFGKLARVTGPGWFVLVPGIENFEKVDLRVQTIDIPPQDIITKGNIECKIDAVIYMKVGAAKEDVIKSVIKVEDYRKAAQLYVASTLRDIAGGMSLAELIANVEMLNSQLKEKLQAISKDWGVLVDAVEIKDINIPKTVLDAMHEEKAAEQKKLARMEAAIAHKAEIEAVKEAAAGLDERALSYYYIRALERMSKGKATKIIFPIELSNLAGLLAGRLAAGLTPAEKREAAKETTEELIVKHKDKISQLFGKDLAKHLVKAVKEEKAKPKKKVIKPKRKAKKKK